MIWEEIATSRFKNFRDEKEKFNNQKPEMEKAIKIAQAKKAKKY